jgi:cell division protein FtsQ
MVAALATFAAMRSPLFTAQHIRVTGIETLDHDGVVALSGLVGENMIGLPVDEARQRILGVPQVRSVEFVRRWPQTVTIRIEERVPFAIWTVGGRDYVVDVEGFVLSSGAPVDSPPHVVEPDSARIMGPGDRVHPDALSLAARIAKESPRVSGQTVQQLEYRPSVGVTAVFMNGTRVTFGDDRSFEYKVAVLSSLLDQLSARNYTPRNVDLRFGERVTYE